MIWLASFPRSGNTFFRVVLHEVYGIESSSFHFESRYPVDPDYDKYPVVKTHLLPGQLVPGDQDIPAVYLVRDGRDALVSIAHHKKDIVEPGTDYEANLVEAILAAGGSYFGGWSRNVNEWLKRASVVIKFEDLIKNPIECVERIRPFMDLPEPDPSRLPTFEELRIKKFMYGCGDKRQNPEEGRKKFFRRGKVGAWKDEMPRKLEKLFWKLHGETARMLGYER